jgi:glycosyltransferase involved in cell wall biosynthesis
MRVTIATRVYTPEVTAASFRMRALAHALAAQADVEVLTTKAPAGSGSDSAEDLGVRVRRAPVLRDRSGAIRGYVQYLSFDIPLFFRLLFSRTDVVVAEAPPTTGFMTAVVGLLRRKPLIYYPGDVWSDAVASMGAPSFVTSAMKAVESFVLRRSSVVIAISPEVAERLIALGADERRVVTAGNGIDTDIFAPDVVPPTDERYFVYTGTMSEWQRPDVFIRGFALISQEFPDVRVKFFGQGSVQDEMRELAQQLVPGRVDFGGVVSPALSAAWIRGASGALVSIVPEIGYDFARPTKIYAAAAVGTPVLFAGPEVASVLVTEAGLGRAADFDEHAVADAMRELLAEAADGRTEDRRGERVTWARENASLQAAARRVVSAIAQVRRTDPTKLGGVSEASDGDGKRES